MWDVKGISQKATRTECTIRSAAVKRMCETADCNSLESCSRFGVKCKYSAWQHHAMTLSSSEKKTMRMNSPVDDIDC